MKKLCLYGVLMLGIFYSCVQKRAGDINVGDSSVTEVVTDQADRALLQKQMPTNEEEIRQYYGDVTTWVDQNKLDTLSFQYNCQEEKKGKVTYYSKSDTLLLIIHQYNEYDHYEAVDRYYIHNDSLYFAFLKSTAWSFQSGEEATKDDITERRIYFAEGKPLKCLEKKYSIFSKSSNNPDKETVENKEVDCTAGEAVNVSYALLTKYNKNPTSGCLE